MKERFSYPELDALQAPLLKSLLDQGAAIESGSIDASLVHLVKLRASQINRCGFCLHMHAAEARKDGEDQQRLDMLEAWHESPYYTEQEKLALALCEKLTRLPDQTISDAFFSNLKICFSDQQISELLLVIININSWNRVVALSHMIPKLNQ